VLVAATMDRPMSRPVFGVVNEDDPWVISNRVRTQNMGNYEAQYSDAITQIRNDIDNFNNLDFVRYSDLDRMHSRIDEMQRILTEYRDNYQSTYDTNTAPRMYTRSQEMIDDVSRQLEPVFFGTLPYEQ